MLWNLITKCSVKSCRTACMNWLLVLLLSLEYSLFLFKYSYQGMGKD
jgi:hypothetical protein